VVDTEVVLGGEDLGQAAGSNPSERIRDADQWKGATNGQGCDAVAQECDVVPLLPTQCDQLLSVPK